MRKVGDEYDLPEIEITWKQALTFVLFLAVLGVGVWRRLHA